MNLPKLTPADSETIEAAAAAFQEIAELIKQLAENIKEKYDEILEELKECEEITERETYEPCLKIGFPKYPQIPVKLWRKNRALFRPYKRGI